MFRGLPLLLALAGSAMACAAATTTNGSGYLPLVSPAASGLTDIALIYQGGTHRLAWTEDQFGPYVSHTNHAGAERWLFDGFLFIEFANGKDREYASGYRKQPARKEEWQWLIDRNFASDAAIPALDARLGAVSKRLGAPARPRKVILTMPEPIAGQTDWGMIGERALDFTLAADRIAACRWQVEAALAKWRAQAPAHLELAGFYWVAEQSGKAREILPSVARIIHEAGLRFFWIPYWRAGGAGDWAALGFDAAYQQPNHFFHPEVEDARLNQACAFARAHGMGLELELDARVRQDLFRPRIDAYLRVFSEEGVRDRAAMAYYEGGGILLSLARSNEPGQRAIYEEIAEWVSGRQALADQRIGRR